MLQPRSTGSLLLMSVKCAISVARVQQKAHSRKHYVNSYYDALVSLIPSQLDTLPNIRKHHTVSDTEQGNMQNINYPQTSASSVIFKRIYNDFKSYWSLDAPAV